MFGRIFCRNATTPDELEVVFAVRRTVLVEELARISDDLVSDDHDAVATNFIAYVDGSPAGTVRVVRDCDLKHLAQPRFAIEKRLPLRHYRDVGRDLIEVSRLAVLPRHRRTSSAVVIALIACAYKYSQEHGITDAFILANCEMDPVSSVRRVAGLPKLFVRLGFQPIGEIREPGYYDGFGVYTMPMHLGRENLGSLAHMYESLAVDGRITYLPLSPEERIAIHSQFAR